MKRIMVIVWKWKEEKIFKVQDSDDLVICLKDKTLDDHAENRVFVESKIREILDKYKNSIVGIFVHDHYELFSLEEIFSKEKVFLFGGGSGAIYYNQFIRSKGLLGNLDDLAKTAKEGSNIVSIVSRRKVTTKNCDR